MKGTCRSANGGGVPSFMLFLHIAGHPLSASPSILSGSHSVQKGSKRGKSKCFFGGCLVFSRENRRPKTAKFKIYLIFEDCRASGVALSLWRWSCPLGAGVQGAGASGVLRCVFRAFLPAFCPLSCFARGGLLANMALFRILRRFFAGFRVWMYICMG